MKCEYCGGSTTKRQVHKHHWFKGKVYIVENVEAEVCLECGEPYFHARTLDEINVLLSSQYPVKERIDVKL